MLQILLVKVNINIDKRTTICDVSNLRFLKDFDCIQSPDLCDENANCQTTSVHGRGKQNICVCEDGFLGKPLKLLVMI